MWELYQDWRETDEAKDVASSGLIGSPDTIRRTLRDFEKAHVDQIILLNQAGKATHEDICSGLDLFAHEVMPEFQDRDGEHQEWKRRVLEGALELDAIDTDPYRLYLIQPIEHLAYMEEQQRRRTEAATTSAV
jgi:hypothetical protein